MDCIHIKLTENKTICFDVKVDRVKCWSPWSITFDLNGRARSHTHVASLKEIKEILRMIEGAREDKHIDCTKLKATA